MSENGEKYPCEGSEIVPETACLQAVVGLWPSGKASLRTFCIMGLGVTVYGKVKGLKARSRSESEYE